MKLLLVFLIMISLKGAIAQGYQKIVYDSNYSYGYYLLGEKVENPLGVLILLPDFGGKAESVFLESKLPLVAGKNNILVVCMPFRPTVFLDDTTARNLNNCLRHVTTTYSVSKDNIVMGGFSSGGVIALSYAEKAQKDSISNYPLKAVFGVDPPVDLVKLWEFFERELKRECPYDKNQIAKNEARFLTNVLKTELKGSPTTNFKNYVSYSPFISTMKDGGNAQYLIRTPVRLYHEVDVQWGIENRCSDLSDRNICAASSMINFLYQKGNKDANLIVSLNRGYRSNGTRHPHSWSIVDEEDCVKWLVDMFKNKK